MKSIFSTLIVMISLSTVISAQTVNDQPVKDLKSEYIQIVGVQNMMGNKMTVEVDLGQDVKEVKIKDEAGKTIKFVTMMEALNFFSKNGFEYVDAYGFTDGDVKTHHYILRKKK